MHVIDIFNLKYSSLLCMRIHILIIDDKQAWLAVLDGSSAPELWTFRESEPPATELGGGIKRAVKKVMGRRRNAGKN